MDQEPLPNKVSTRRLKLSYWYISHKLQLRQLFVGFLMLICLSLYSFSVYKALQLFVVEGPEYSGSLRQLTSSYINYPQHRIDQMASNLQVIDVIALPVSDGRYDYIATVINPNPDFAASDVKFQLVSGSSVVAEKDSFVLPGEQKYITFFGQEGGGNLSFLATDVKWQRVHFFDEYSAERLRFTASNLDFKDSRTSGLRGQLPVSTLTFDLSNNSAYNYWTAGVYMILKNNNRIVAGNYITVDQFLSGQTRSLEMRWYDSIPSVNNPEVLVEVDILDPDVYMPVQGE